MVDAARGGGPSELLDGIAEVAAAAGVDPERLPARCSAVTGDSGSRGDPGPSLAARPDGKEDMIIDVTTRSVVASDSDRGNPPGLTPERPTPSSSEVAAPRRPVCGIWFDPLHYVRLEVPPCDIIPFLGPGSSTFAGTLFWSLLEHQGGAGCRRAHADQGGVLKAMFGHARATQDISASLVTRMVAARLEYRRTGSVGGELAATADPDLAALIRDRVEAEYRARGDDLAPWLDLVAVEERVRAMVGDAGFAALLEAARGRGDPRLRDLLDAAKCALCDTSTCFGDGPRWHFSLVDVLFDPCRSEIKRRAL